MYLVLFAQLLFLQQKQTCALLIYFFLYTYAKRRRGCGHSVTFFYINHIMQKNRAKHKIGFYLLINITRLSSRFVTASLLFFYSNPSISFFLDKYRRQINIGKIQIYNINELNKVKAKRKKKIIFLINGKMVIFY